MVRAQDSLQLLFCLAGSILVSASPAHAQTPAGRQGFCVHGQGVNLPVGRFLLIRSGTQTGALRITKIAPDSTTRPRAGEWLGTVAYESYFTDGTRPLSNSTESRMSDQLRFGVMKGWSFHTSWQSGKMKARVGPWKFVFFDEDGMFMTTYDRWNGIEHDSGLEFAPTAASELDQLDPKDPRLHWYRRDPNTNVPCPVPVPNPLQKEKAP